MSVLTAEELDILKDDMIDLLREYDLFHDTCIYVNGNRYSDDWHNPDNVRVEEDMDPHVYFEYAPANPEDQLFSMSFEGPLNHVLNYDSRGYEKFLDEFEDLFERNGLYYEFGDAWNLSCYPL